MSEENLVETFQFQAEINQLMSLIINTFYSNKDIFLRELISNASDAIDKIRHESLKDKTVLDTKQDLCINIETDKENKVLSITDTGIGMTRADLLNNLGTIAQSGTKNFMEALSSNEDMNMIGQFGVGFYSAYLVADKVVVTTKNNNDDEYVWESSAGGTFTITKSETPSLNRGTRIMCYLKDDQYDYLEESKIKELVKKHSEFINYPISLLVEKTIEKEVSDDEDDDEGDEEGKVEEESTKKKTKKVTEISNEWEKINTNQPIWTRNPTDITNEEYGEFYKKQTNDWQEHLSVKHFSVEGQLEFTGLLFLPKTAPFSMFDTKQIKNNIKLYVRRVFVMENCPDLIPEWLSFVKGVVDSEDLPLNISRETLQQNKIMKVIRKNVVKKTLEMFHDLQDDDEKYKTFYQQYSKSLKLGIHEDASNKSKLANLLRYYSFKSQDEMISLDSYIENMNESQNNIYFIGGESVSTLASSPFLEVCKKKNIDVLFMTETVDEYCMQTLDEYKGKKFVNISRDGLKFEETDEEKQLQEKTEREYEKLSKHIKEILGDRIQKVNISHRLVDNPYMLVTSEHGRSANMERILKAQALGHDMNMNMTHSGTQRIFEINPYHKIISELKTKYEIDSNDTTLKDLVNLMYDTSILSSGFTLDDPNKFTERINKMISLGLLIDDNESEQSEELPPLDDSDNSDEDMNEMETID